MTGELAFAFAAGVGREWSAGNRAENLEEGTLSAAFERGRPRRRHH